MNLSTVLRAMCEFAKKMLLPINALVVNQPNSTQHSSAFTISMQLNTCCRFRTLDLTYSLYLNKFQVTCLKWSYCLMSTAGKVQQLLRQRSSNSLQICCVFDQFCRRNVGNPLGWDGLSSSRWALGRRNQYWANTATVRHKRCLEMFWFFP